MVKHFPTQQHPVNHCNKKEAQQPLIQRSRIVQVLQKNHCPSNHQKNPFQPKYSSCKVPGAWAGDVGGTNGSPVMPSIPGKQLELEKHIQSSSSAPSQHHLLLALTASSISPPSSAASIHVERSRGKTTGGGGLASMAGDDRQEGSSQRLGRNSGKSQTLRTKKGGGGFLLGMGSGYGIDVRDLRREKGFKCDC